MERSPGPGEKRGGGLQAAPMSRLHRPRSQEALGEPAQSTCLRDFLPEERGG